MGKSGESDAGSGPALPRGRDTQIFICDASAEAGRLLTALQARGYAIVDVPLGLLPARVAHEFPIAVLCDADAHEARPLLEEARQAAAGVLSVVLIADPKGAIAQDEELRRLAALVLARPIDIDTAVDRVADLTGPPARGSHRPRIGLPRRSPVLVASARKPYRSDGYDAKTSSSHPPEPAEPTGEPLWPTDWAAPKSSPGLESRLAYESSGYSRPSSSSIPPSSDRLSLSPETQSILDEGQQRVSASPQLNSPRPTRLGAGSHEGGEEIRADFLEALEQPLGDAEFDLPAEPQEQTSGGTQEGQRPDDKSMAATNPGMRPSRSFGWGPSSESFADAPPSTGAGASRAPQIEQAGQPAPTSGGPPSAQTDEDDEPTNPGGRPPTHPPGPLDHDGAGHDAPPPLDDLSDLLGTKSSRPPDSLPSVDADSDPPEPTKPGQLSATVPPPNRTPVPASHPTDVISSPSRLPLSGSRGAPSLRPSPLSQIQPEHRDQGGAPTHDRMKVTWNRQAALYALARAVQERRSGAVAQQDGNGLRRIVLTDGDISTVTSTLESESLAHFLASRGDISQEVLESLGAIPGFGRHAGAALIARGLLQQEDLWPVLRSHAEWILGHALVSEQETLIEETVPARILEEPAVFGGAAGTEIYLETVRRVVSPEHAYDLLGGREMVVGIGRHESLLGESALPASEQQQILDSLGKPLSQLHDRRSDLLPVVLGLTYLDVLTTGGEAPASPLQLDEDVRLRSEEIDDEAFVKRVMTRRSLVEDGDYFSILGISRSATPYEIDRARDELLAEYADSKLTARTVHLKSDLRLLRETVEEAHLVLRDDVRRSRYRAALEAMPA